MKTVVLDSSALLAFINDRVDVIEQANALLEEPLRFVVLKPCLSELRVVAKPAAFDAITKYLGSRASVVDVPQQRPDDSILEYALKQSNCAVLSLDGRLRKRLKSKGIQTITLRGASLVLT